MYMNDELVMSPSFPFQLYEETMNDESNHFKKYEETIMNVHER